MAAVDVIDAYLSELPGGCRRLAHTEWGVSVEAEALGSQPLDIGVRLADGLVRVQAPLHGPGAELDPWMLLWWNRQTRLVRFSATASHEPWIHADLPLAGLDDDALDRLLGLVVEAAAAARAAQAARSRSRSAR